jgi:hypothetical protein
MEAGYVIDRPNRAKASSKRTRAIVVLLLLVSVALMLLVLLGGWSALQGGQPLAIAYVAIYLLMAVRIAGWSRGMLPVAAALAIILLIFAAVAFPGWFARDEPGFSTPQTIFGTTGFESSVLGVLTLLLIPVQVLLIAFAALGFRQDWHVEVERPAGRPDAPGRRVPARA